MGQLIQYYVFPLYDNRHSTRKISREEANKTVEEKQNNKCNWFGVDIDFSRNDWLRSPSLDRLDNDKGYTRDNVVLTCRSANLARNKSTVEEMGNFLSELKNSILSKEIA